MIMVINLNPEPTKKIKNTKKLLGLKRSQGWIRDDTNTSSSPTHLIPKIPNH